MMILEVLKRDRNIITYRPELNTITGSVTATILLQQILFRLGDCEEFYKFKEPCSHRLYRIGDSWCEELGFTRKEFDGAIERLKQNGFINTRITMDRLTFYSINEETLYKALNVLYVKTETDFTKSPIDTLDTYTENTTKTTSKSNVVALKATDIPYDEIIDYLNKKIGASYKSNSVETKKLIKARFNQGFTIEDFKTVIDKKVLLWGNDIKMQGYLRPQTLFSNKFEAYLNEIVSGAKVAVANGIISEKSAGTGTAAEAFLRGGE